MSQFVFRETDWWRQRGVPHWRGRQDVPFGSPGVSRMSQFVFHETDWRRRPGDRHRGGWLDVPFGLPRLSGGPAVAMHGLWSLLIVATRVVRIWLSRPGQSRMSRPEE